MKYRKRVGNKNEKKEVKNQWQKERKTWKLNKNVE